MQNDLDCFLLACYHGKLKVVRELVNRHHVGPHVVNEVGAWVHVCACTRVCVCCVDPVGKIILKDKFLVTLYLILPTIVNDPVITSQPCRVLVEMFHNSSKMNVIVSQDTKFMFVNPLNLRKIILKEFRCNKRLNCVVDLCLFQIHFP